MNHEARLTDDEKVILVGIARGIPRKILAAKLKTSVRVVDSRLAFVQAKCQVRGTAALTHFAIINKFVRLGDIAES